MDKIILIPSPEALPIREIRVIRSCRNKSVELAESVVKKISPFTSAQFVQSF